SITLMATAGAGETVDFYTGACGGGGTLIGSGSSQLVAPTGHTTYYLRARNTTSGCFATNSVTITIVVDPLPQPPVPSPNVTICQGDSTTISATVDNGTGTETVDWFTGGCGTVGSIQVGFNTLSLNVSPSTSTLYYARSKNTSRPSLCPDGCATVFVTVN